MPMIKCPIVCVCVCISAQTHRNLFKILLNENDQQIVCNSFGGIDLCARLYGFLRTFALDTCFKSTLNLFWCIYFGFASVLFWIFFIEKTKNIRVFKVCTCSENVSVSLQSLRSLRFQT